MDLPPKIPDDRFDQHRPALTLWAKVQSSDWLRSRIEPADLVQQTLLEAVRGPDPFAGRAEHEVLALLRRMLSNNLIDAARKFRHDAGAVSIDAFADSSFRMADALDAKHSSPSERADRNDCFEKLAEGLSRLPDDQRIAVEMKYLQHTTVGEIAKLLDRSEGAVSALLFRAIIALRNDRIIQSISPESNP